MTGPHSFGGRLRILMEWGLEWGLQPGRCLLCDLPSGRRRDLCDVCLHDLPRLRWPCPLCALPAPAAGPCPQCIETPPEIDRLRAACPYAPPADALVTALKFRSEAAAARVMAELFLLRHPDAADDETVIVPVPLHPWRQWRRGWNQAALLARALRRAHPALDLHPALRRVRATPSQTRLGARARRDNLVGAFRARGPVPERVVIIDDVCTTGATLDAAARALRAAGARRVEAWVFARTLPPSPGRAPV